MHMPPWFPPLPRVQAHLLAGMWACALVALLGLLLAGMLLIADAGIDG